MDLSFQQVSYIISLAEYKSFVKAAKACFVTQPTLSMQIKKAEESLNFLLFNRDRNPIELTEKGKEILPILYEIKSSFNEIETITLKLKGSLKEELKIGVIPTIAAYLVPYLFANKENLMSEFKWVFLEHKTEEIITLLEQKKIDIGIIAGPFNSENLETVSLFNEEIMIYTPSLNVKKLRISDIEKEQPWLLNSGNCLRTQMIHFCKLNENSTFSWNYEGGNIELLMKMVDQFGGYTLVPYFYNETYVFPENALKHLFSNQNNKVPARNIIALKTKSHKKGKEIQQLLQFIKVRFANLEQKKMEILKWK